MKNDSQLIVVQGLGFVGSVMSHSMCEFSFYTDYAVVAVDLE